MSIAAKIRAVLTIKQQIKAAIAAKGIVINDQTPFSAYATKIQEILSIKPEDGAVYFNVTPTEVAIKELKLPSTVRAIQTNAFVSLNVSKIVLNEGLLVIGYGAFNFSSISGKIVIPKSLKIIENRAFADCKIEEVVCLADCEIQQNTFQSCSNLEKVDLSSCMSLTAIPYGTFEFCDKLNEVVLPKQTNLNFIQEKCFHGAKSLKVFDFSNITSISSQAFRRSGISSANMPLVKVSASSAFRDSAIEYAIMPSITRIPIYLFANCPNCKFIEVGDQIKYIDACAFEDSNNIEAFLIKCDIPPSLNEEAFPDLTKSKHKIYVPDDSVDAYTTAKTWNLQADRIYPISKFIMPIL